MTQVETIVATLVTTFKPLLVVLYGSQARGDARPDSDFDLLVVVPDDRRMGPIELSVERARVHVVVTSPARLLDGLVTVVLRAALDEGKIVFGDGSGLGWLDLVADVGTPELWRASNGTARTHV